MYVSNYENHNDMFVHTASVPASISSLAFPTACGKSGHVKLHTEFLMHSRQVRAS